MVSTCRIVLCLFACKRSTSPHSSLLRYYKDIRIAILGTFKHACLWPAKRYYQLVENFDVYFHAKKYIYPSDDIVNLLFWKMRAHVATPIKNNSTTFYKTLIFMCKQKVKQKVNLIPQIFLYVLHLKNPAVWLTKNILGNNSRTRILPDMQVAMEGQE